MPPVSFGAISRWRVATRNQLSVMQVTPVAVGPSSGLFFFYRAGQSVTLYLYLIKVTTEKIIAYAINLALTLIARNL